MTSRYRSGPQTPHAPTNTTRPVFSYKPMAAFLPFSHKNRYPPIKQTQSVIVFLSSRSGTEYPHQALATKKCQPPFHSHVYNCAQSYPQAVYKNVQNPSMGLSPEFLHTLWIKLCTSSPPGALFESFRKSPGCSPQKLRN